MLKFVKSANKNLCPKSKPALNCFGSRPTTKGEEYFGEFGNDQYHGLGVYNWRSGSAFVGNWKNGQYKGEGLYVWANRAARYWKYWNGVKGDISDSTINQVFPALKSQFNYQSKSDRKRIQSRNK